MTSDGKRRNTNHTMQKETEPSKTDAQEDFEALTKELVEAEQKREKEIVPEETPAENNP